MGANGTDLLEIVKRRGKRVRGGGVFLRIFGPPLSNFFFLLFFLLAESGNRPAARVRRRGALDLLGFGNGDFL